jgi:hypothetical protein
MPSPLLERQFQFSRMLGLFLYWMAEQNYYWSMGDCWRSSDKLLCPACAEPITYQELLRNNGRSQTLDSKHASRLAVDLVLFTAEGRLAQGEAYRPLAEKWESLGGKAGFRFGIDPADYGTKVGWDPGHFEI